MAKTLVIDADERTRVPFLRGILTRSLQEAGLSFEIAYQVASEVRQQLTDIETISTTKLREMVVKGLGKHSADHVLVERYELGNDSSVPVISVKNRDGVIAPYSNSQFGRELEIIGLEPEETRIAVAKMFDHLVSRGERVIRDDHLGLLTYRCLHQDPEYGPDIANRYLAWINFCRSGKPLILLVGGTAATGKSTIATTLASRLDIVRYQSTDMLREVMRMMIPERLVPVLHQSSFNAGKVLPVEPCNGASKGSSKARDNRMITGYRSQAELLSVPCEAVIQRGLKERVSLILEGVHVQPHLLSQISQDQDAVVVHVMLAVLKQKELKKRIKGRSTKVPQRRSERYLSSFDDIFRLQAYLLDEADEHEVPIIVNEDKESVVNDVMKIIVDRLQEDFSSTPDEVFGRLPAASAD